MVGTNTYSAPGLVSLMQSWVDSGRASIMVRSSRLTLDPTCDTNLDSLYDTDCLYSPTKPPTAAPFNRHGVSAGEIAGILIGVVIILLLIALVVVIILKKWRPKVIRRLVFLYCSRHEPLNISTCPQMYVCNTERLGMGMRMGMSLGMRL